MTILRTLRPAHWVKNFLVLAPLFFSGKLIEPAVAVRALLAFGVFCAVSSAVYAFNDYMDAERDRSHEFKKDRPYASGRLSAAALGAIIAVCLLLAATGCLALPWGVAGMAGAYVAGMTLYSLVLKRVQVIGVVIIALGMLARIFAGAVAIDVCVSSWVLPCTFFLACYVVTGKRIFDAGPRGGGKPREKGEGRREKGEGVLFFWFSGAAALCYYIFYSFNHEAIMKFGTRWLELTAAPVALGLWRYSRIVTARNRPKREHFQTLLLDPVIIFSLALWVGCFFFIVYLF